LVASASTIRAEDQPLPLEHLQVTPYRRSRHGELRRKRRHVDPPALHDRGRDLGEPVTTLHGPSPAGAARLAGPAAGTAGGVAHAGIIGSPAAEDSSVARPGKHLVM
jgi:hypothetical protein